MKRYVIYTLVGVAGGLTFSFVSQALGSTCTILCRPHIAGTIFGLYGLAFAFAGAPAAMVKKLNEESDGSDV
ncbi:hypothetical protein KDL45_06080 [bacterium]|nr:hypothetical protein [bacterium]